MPQDREGAGGRGSQETLQLQVDTELYSEEAVFRACYLFTDRCYIFLSDDGPSKISVEFSPKQGAPEDLQDIRGEFANELIAQRLRISLATETKAIREAIVTQAFAEGGFDGREQ